METGFALQSCHDAGLDLIVKLDWAQGRRVVSKDFPCPSEISILVTDQANFKVPRVVSNLHKTVVIHEKNDMNNYNYTLLG